MNFCDLLVMPHDSAVETKNSYRSLGVVMYRSVNTAMPS